MIYIQKGEPSERVREELFAIQQSERWKEIKETDVNAMRSVFDNDVTCKPEIRDDLLREQHFICAYCMQPIENAPLHMSIEHVVPLSKCKDKVLDFQNYLGVCKGGRDLPKNKKRCTCCDESKGNKELKAINPFEKAQMNQIKYLPTGEIYYERQEKDLYQTLRLNGKYDKEKRMVRQDTKTSLVKNRKDVYESCEEYIRELEEQGLLTKEKIASDIQGLLEMEQYEGYIGVRIFLLKQMYDLLAEAEK